MKVTTFKLKVIKREISFIFFKNKVKLKTENDANRSWFRLQLYSVAKRQIKLCGKNYKMPQNMLILTIVAQKGIRFRVYVIKAEQPTKSKVVF